MRPHQLRQQALEDLESGDSGSSKGTGAVEREVEDVLETAHGNRESADSARFSRGRLNAALARRSKVQLADGTLSIGDTNVEVGAAKAAEIEMLGPPGDVVADLARGLASPRPVLLSAAKGSGAAFASRWYLEATNTPHEFVSLTNATTLDALAGLRRPDGDGQLEIRDGPLTTCVRDGGVLVVDSLEDADDEVLAQLKALAKGAEYFHHPVSGEPIKVSENFKLVLIHDAATHAPADLLRVSNVSEIRAYTADEQASLLTSRYRVPTELAKRLVKFAEALKEKAELGSEIEYGHNFALSWSLLDRVGRRLERKDITDARVASALTGVYGMRLAPGPMRDAFRALLSEHGLGSEKPPERRPREAASDGFLDLGGEHREAFSHSMSALAAGETVLLNGPGQSGATRLVEELAAARKQHVVTIPGNASSDVSMLMETPAFTEDGRLYLKPGRLADALMSGAMIYVDHVDHMSPERQNAFFQLQKMTTLPVLEDGKIVEKPIPKKSAIVLSSTGGVHASRSQPNPADRMSVTEIKLPAPSLDEVLSLVAPHLEGHDDVKALVEQTARDVHAAAPDLGLTKMQRFVDFARASVALSEHMSPERAVLRAMRLVYSPPAKFEPLSELKKAARKTPKPDGKMWHKLLGIDDADAKKRLEGSPYEITAETEKHLDVLALAHRLGRPVILHGPAGAGKTVLGALYARLMGMDYERVNLSDATEPREVMGGAGVRSEGGRVIVAHVDGPAPRAADGNTVLAVDEYNLHRDIHMLLKSAADHRGVVIDAEGNIDRSFGNSFMMLSGNFVDPKTGRVEAPPTFTDSTFGIVVDSPPAEERIERIARQTTIDPAIVSKVVHAYADMETFVGRNKKKFEPRAGPLTFTERDMQKALAAAEHLAKRDGITDETEVMKLVGREVYRVVADVVEAPAGREAVLALLRNEKHFGPELSPPVRPKSFEKVVIDGVSYLQIGQARLPMRSPEADVELEAALQELVPKAKGIADPIGPQLQFLESFLLALELGQPVAVVGATGTGKTMLMRWLAHQVGMPVHEQACHGDMTPEDMIGTNVIDEDKGVRYEYAPMSASAKMGGWAALDEFLTAPNSTRETTNPASEKTEIQILNKRPTERIPFDEWHPDSRLIVLTNAGDIRKDDFSEAEASRFRIVAIPDFETLGDYEELAHRDYAAPVDVGDYRPPTDRLRNEILDAAISLAGHRLESADPADPDAAQWEDDGGPTIPHSGVGAPAVNTPLGKALVEAVQFARGKGPKPKLDPALFEDAPVLEPRELEALADVLHAIDNKQAKPLRKLVDRWVAAQTPEIARRMVRMAGDAVGPNTLSRAETEAVIDGRLANPHEAQMAAEMFIALRDQTRKSKTPGLSPLTPRLFTSFLDLYVQLRTRRTMGDAAARAAELSLFSKLPPKVQKGAPDLLAEYFGNASEQKKPEAPRAADDGVWFGDTLVKYGREKPWPPDAARYPLTPERCRNHELFADAFAHGRGRPIACTDDANGETVEEIREFGRRTGRPVTVITLAPNVDLERMIEKLAQSDDEEAVAGFAPILQQIGQAVRDGHVLVIRGANRVPSNVLERLNSLGDGRMGLKLPRSKRWLEANEDFRLVLMKQPGAQNPFSPALENRLLEPLLSTREGANITLGERAAELAQIVARRTDIDEDIAMRLAIFHTYVNDVVKEKGFAGALNVGSFLNRDAESVARRLSTLDRAGGIEDEMEMLAFLVQQVYGGRFDAPEDRQLIADFAKTVFGDADASQVHLAGDLNPSPKLLRLGAWAVQRDPRRDREGVPAATEMLPFTPSLVDLQQRIFPAFQFDEVLYLHGDETLAMGAVNSVARLTTSPVFEVEASEKLSEAYLFGGMLHDPKTGKWGEYEGVLWQAQREGGTLVIKDASKLPPQILTQLAEIAATGHVTRMVGDRIDTRPRAFRLVLHSEEAYLPTELASLATRVPVPELEDRAELEEILAHTLLGVPGGPKLASLFCAFAADAESLARDAELEDQGNAPRQALRFGTSRLFSAARELAKSYDPNEEFETPLADVFTRLYLAPARGMPLEDKLRDRIEELAKDLDRVLHAEVPQTIDYVERPQLAALDRDYQAAAPAMTQAVLGAARKQLSAAIDRADTDRIIEIATAIGGSKVLPESITNRAARSTTKLTDDDAAVVDKEARSLLGTITRALEDTDAPDFLGTTLELLRGARLWDLEHRMSIVERYDELAKQIEGPRSALGSAIARARQRFQTAGALARVEQMRADVGRALDVYRNRSGEADEQVNQLFRQLIEKWDLVSTSPIFRDHHLLRKELAELQVLLEEIRAVHDERAQTTPEVEGLLDALSAAGETLEGLRIAEQSAELRRELDRNASNAQQLFDKMKTEVLEVQRLEGARAEHQKLARVAQRVAELRSSNLFLSLDVDVDIARPEQRTREELQPRAQREARAIVAKELATERARLAAELAVANQSDVPPDPATMFDDYDPTDGGLVPAVPAAESVANDASAERFAEMERKLFTYEQKRLEHHESAILERLEASEKENAAGAYRDRVEARAHEVAAKVHRTVADLSAELDELSRNLDLETAAPELHQQLEATRAEIAEVAAEARRWSTKLVESVEKVGLAILDVFTLNMFKFSKKHQSRELDLGPAQANAAKCIEDVGAWVKTQIDALPDFGKIPRHEKATSDLEAELLAADTLGQLATRFAKLTEAYDGETSDVFRSHLNSLMGRLGQSREDQRLLQLVQSFSDGADMLSTQIAGQEGVAIELAPIVEMIMRAAETLRGQSLTDKSFRASGRALKLAVQRIEAFGGRDQLPSVLRTIGDQMTELLELLSRGTESPLAVRTEEASAEMLRLLGDREQHAVDDLAGASEVEIEDIPDPEPDIVEDEALEGDVARAFEATDRRLRVDAFDRRLRSTEIKTVQIELDRYEQLSEVKPPKEEVEVDEAVEAVRQRALDAAGELDALVKDAVGELSGQKETVLRVLGEIERGKRGDALSRWDDLLSETATLLADIVEGASQGRVGAGVNRAVAKLKKLVRGLQAIETIPPEVAATIETLIDGTRPLAKLFGTPAFDARAISWAAHAEGVLRDAQASIRERRRELDESPGDLPDLSTALGVLDRVVGELSERRERLGAYSRFSLLAHVHQRLSAIVASFEEPQRGQAEAMLVRVREAADSLLPISGGEVGEQAIADLHGAYMDLGAAFARTTQADAPVEQYEKLGDLVWSLIGSDADHDPYPALERVRLARSVLEALAKKTRGGAQRAVREMIRTLHTVQSGLLIAAFEAAEADFSTSTGGYVDAARTSVVDISETAERFVRYDPLRERKLVADLADEFDQALTTAKDRLHGPGAVWIARAIVTFVPELEALAEEDDQLGRLASDLLADHDDVISQAKELAAETEHPERFTAMLEATAKEVRATRDSRVSRKSLTWISNVVPALKEVMAADPDDLAAVLDRVEGEHFPELAEARRRRQEAEQRRKEAEAAPRKPMTSAVSSSSSSSSSSKPKPKAPIVVPKPSRAVLDAMEEDGVGALTRSGLRRSGVALALDGKKRPRGERNQPLNVDFSALGIGGAGGPFEQPDRIDAPRTKGSGEGAAETDGTYDYDRDSDLGEVKREPLVGRGLSEKSAPISPIEIGKKELGSITKALDAVKEEARQRIEGEVDELGRPALNPYQQFKEDNRDRISEVVRMLRALGNTELCVLIDQSWSTHEKFNGTSIIEQEQAGVGLILGAVQQSESNCSVLGFGGDEIGVGEPLAEEGPWLKVFAHKSPADPLDDETGNAVYELAGNCDGGTDIEFSLEIAARPEMFSANVNNKLVVLFTDAQDPSPDDTRQKIEDLRAQGYGVLVVGMGDASHVEDVAGEWGIHVTSMADMLEKLPKLLEKALVHHGGRKLGDVMGSAQGIGVDDGQHPLVGASAASLDLVDDLHSPMPDEPDGGDIVVPSGAKREQKNLADRTRYEAAVREVKQRRAARAKSPELKQARQEIASMESQQRRSGLQTTLREGFAHGMPRSRGMEWEKKQLSGPYFDPDQLPYYYIGLAQGVPELRLFMRRKPIGKSASRMVVLNDISTSTAKPELRRRLMEASMAVTNAYKSGVPNGEVAHMSLSDKVRLHHGFDMDWNDAAKANLMMELNEAYPATNDERAGVEATQVLDMMGTDVGLVVVFTDGQGMPGTPEVVKQAAEQGYGVLVVGVGPECRSVVRFGDNALYARNVTQLGHKFWDRLTKAWDEAGRTVK